MDTKKLRQKILDLAIHGKLVPQDSNDEPASVLLERIRAEKERLVKEGKIKKSKASKTSDTYHYENIPFEVPSSWEWTTLENILELVSGQDFPPEKYNANVSGIPYIIGASNIDNEQLVINRWTEYPSVYSYLNDLLVVCKGAGIGKMAINNIGTVHIARQIQAVRVYTNYINIRYIKAVIKNNIENIISKANGLIPGLKRELLLSLEIPLPPFPEQQRIVAEIEKCFALIDIIENGKADLQTIIKQAKNKILDLAIHGKLVSQDPNDEPASELLKRINPNAEITCDNGHYQNLPFEVPQNWSWTTLGKIGKWQSGSTPSRLNKDYYNGDIPWLKTGDLNDGYITHIPEYITEKALNETSVKLNPSGSVLIAMYGATIGKIGILTYPATTNQACCACETFNGIDKEFLFFFLLSHRDEFIKMGGGGAQPNISKEKIINTYIALPPFAEQKRIVSAVKKAFVQLDTIMESL